jgi:hypothetical protein
MYVHGKERVVNALAAIRFHGGYWYKNTRIKSTHFFSVMFMYRSCWY